MSQFVVGNLTWQSLAVTAMMNNNAMWLTLENFERQPYPADASPDNRVTVVLFECNRMPVLSDEQLACTDFICLNRATVCAVGDHASAYSFLVEPKAVPETHILLRLPDKYFTVPHWVTHAVSCEETGSLELHTLTSALDNLVAWKDMDLKYRRIHARQFLYTSYAGLQETLGLIRPSYEEMIGSIDNAVNIKRKLRPHHVDGENWSALRLVAKFFDEKPENIGRVYQQLVDDAEADGLTVYAYGNKMPVSQLNDLAMGIKRRMLANGDTLAFMYKTDVDRSTGAERPAVTVISTDPHRHAGNIAKLFFGGGGTPARAAGLIDAAVWKVEMFEVLK